MFLKSAEMLSYILNLLQNYIFSEYIIMNQYIHFNHIIVFPYKYIPQLRLLFSYWLSLREFPRFCYYHQYCTEQSPKHLPGHVRENFSDTQVQTRDISTLLKYSLKWFLNIYSHRIYFWVPSLHFIVLFSSFRLLHFGQTD